jgi:uncharacterized membrane protein
MNGYKGPLLMLLSASCLTLGQFIWKIMPGFILLFILMGFLLYAISGFSMIAAYRYGELSALQPLNSISYVLTILISIFILREKVTITKIARIKRETIIAK